MGMAPRPAADVEHATAFRQAERVKEKGNLLLGAFGERVPEIGAAEMVGDALEPVRCSVGATR
jgi:hypothetical protein